jgi:hypothetical protein
LVRERCPVCGREVVSEYEDGILGTVIDHKKLMYDEEFAAYCGRFVVDGRTFEAIVTVPEKRPERSWAIAEKAVDLVLHRFSTVEKVVEKKLAPRLVMWIAGEIEVAEIARRVSAAMKATKVILVHADHEFANIYFNGPRFVRGHRIEVTMAKDGKLYTKLAG